MIGYVIMILCGCFLLLGFVVLPSLPEPAPQQEPVMVETPKPESKPIVIPEPIPEPESEPVMVETPPAPIETPPAPEPEPESEPTSPGIIIIEYGAGIGVPGTYNVTAIVWDNMVVVKNHDVLVHHILADTGDRLILSSGDTSLFDFDAVPSTYQCLIHPWIAGKFIH